MDGDGTGERLGTADRVSFRAETGVVVVVRPKPRGVGDEGGNGEQAGTARRMAPAPGRITGVQYPGAIPMPMLRGEFRTLASSPPRSY